MLNVRQAPDRTFEVEMPMGYGDQVPRWSLQLACRRPSPSGEDVFLRMLKATGGLWLLLETAMKMAGKVLPGAALAVRPARALGVLQGQVPKDLEETTENRVVRRSQGRLASSWNPLMSMPAR